MKRLVVILAFTVCYINGFGQLQFFEYKCYENPLYVTANVDTIIKTPNLEIAPLIIKIEFIRKTYNDSIIVFNKDSIHIEDKFLSFQNFLIKKNPLSIKIDSIPIELTNYNLLFTEYKSTIVPPIADMPTKHLSFIRNHQTAVTNPIQYISKHILEKSCIVLWNYGARHIALSVFSVNVGNSTTFTYNVFYLVRKD
jgi:hypothetical protein